MCPGHMWEDEDVLGEDDRLVRRVDEMLPVLLAPLQRGVGARRTLRLQNADAALRACLEAHAEQLLTSTELDVLPFEQADAMEGAVARVASVEVLLLLLPFFLREPEWFGEDAEDRRLRIRIADVLAHAIPGLPEMRGFSCGCEVWSVEYAISAARRELRELRRAERGSGPGSSACGPTSVTRPQV